MDIRDNIEWFARRTETYVWRRGCVAKGDMNNDMTMGMRSRVDSLYTLLFK